MYRCNDTIGCLSVSAYRIGGILNVESYKINGDIEISAKRIGVKPNIIASVIDSKPNVICKPIGKKLVVICSLVCTVNKAAYLDVNPTYVWLTPDMLSSAEFDIISNTDWIIN